MEKRVELEKRGRPAEEITELNLDNCRATQIEGLTDEFKNLESLSLINVGLTTLKGFPTLPNLRRLELSDNRIPGGLNNLQGSTKLQYLNLSGNKIKDIETLKPLQELKELKNLDLFNCEITNEDNYREKVFELLEDLMYLDGYDRKGGEAEDEDEEGDDDEDDEDIEGEDGSEVIDVDDEDDDDDDDDDDDEDDDEDEDDLDEDGEVGVGLDYLNKDDISDDEEGEDFDPEGEAPEGEEADGEAEEPEEPVIEDEEARGTKRKHDDDGEEEGA